MKQEMYPPVATPLYQILKQKQQTAVGITSMQSISILSTPLILYSLPNHARPASFPHLPAPKMKKSPLGLIEANTEQACKPGSVSSARDGSHLSGMPVAWHLKQPYPRDGRATLIPSYLALLRVGFAKPASYLTAGAPLPHRFILAAGSSRVGGLISVALSLGSPPLDVIQHPALRSPDFPQIIYFICNCPACSQNLTPI